MTTTGISKIVIQIAGQEIVCTPQQIKDLKEALDKMYPVPQWPQGYLPCPVYPKPYRWDSPNIHYCENPEKSVSLKVVG